MSALDTIFSAGNVVKRRVKDFAKNPRAYLEMAGDQQRRQWRENPEEQALNYFNPEAGLAGLAGVVKPKGGNWLTGSVENALRGLKPLPQPGTGQIHPQLQPIADWIEGPLTKYVKTRMASPDDEVRKLAEQGVLHFEPTVGAQNTLHAGTIRSELGGSQSAISPVGKGWEDLSDAAIGWGKAGGLKQFHPEQEWLGKVNPRTLVYELEKPGNLGFSHLIDELSNALNPASGLPRHLQLSPEAMEKLSMEKAVRRVADINAWRAAQKAEANRKLAEQASLVREYAENNPKGLRWVELKQGALPEGFTIRKDAFGVEEIVDPSGKVVTDAGTLKDPRRQALADQLKYEGDVMGHCVGGYCDDVLSGRSRIFSLRDAKGEPHVTVEVQPDPEMLSPAYRWDKPSIAQIKGKQNKAPNDEYLPFVQDFVRNNPLGGQWSDVGDLGNTGLRKVDWASDVLEGFKKHNIDAPEYGTVDEINAALNALIKARGFASGGSVTAAPQDSGYNSSVPSWDIFAEAE